MLVQAAAQQWQVEPASCTAANGTYTHAASGRTLAYGDLVDAASALPVPADPPLKDPKNFTLIGKPLKRFDTPNKTDGKVIYGIDAMLPGMKFATLAFCPVFGGKVAHVDDSAAKKVPGVRQIVVLDDLVAVVGDHMGAPSKASTPLWSPGTKDPTPKSIRATSGRICAPPANRTVPSPNSIGDTDKGLTQGKRIRRRIRTAVPGARHHGAAELQFVFGIKKSLALRTPLSVSPMELARAPSLAARDSSQESHSN